ncbi:MULTISPECIES: chemotaxis protein CheW [unclassified Tolypothrix]|uniref:chemotaxis protein CheW n=2 Tax=Tolypothrix TaxID=111782 RepID=UPI0005F8288F|nr:MULTISPECIES: chemotaxis protein CheW [unclassified Tolypothrix]MBE9080849.1 chemotaxis protein CheW [Tolypothrix sp. LEGE 11397]UYD25287.1 chemotaxis protein CheW [Tolypothrix sp. PCC 7712]UYD32473.1 chemotaxis protein CheW [Tolypothrix sp. PCC 7601]BAY91203.1 putative CheW protein [Microchaete diplosiphon NIES-3275]
MLMLLFHIGNNLYAIESSRVIEVIPRVSYREVHHVPSYVAGVFNYRGVIVPVIDLCHLIRDKPSQANLSTRVMIVSYSGGDNTLQYMGLMAEKVIKTVNKSANDFLKSGIKTNDARYLGDMIMDEKGMIQNIDLELLFNNFIEIDLLAIKGNIVNVPQSH